MERTVIACIYRFLDTLLHVTPLLSGFADMIYVPFLCDLPVLQGLLSNSVRSVVTIAMPIASAGSSSRLNFRPCTT
jgi:hypothetical protein